MNENEAKRTFQFSDDLIFYENTAWVPVQVSLIREGFMRAWLEGARSWNDYSASDSAPPFYPVLDAWEKYPSVGIAGESTEVERPLVSLVENAFESALYRFIRREIDPQVQALQDRLNDDNNDRTSRVHNRLGILYAQYGLLTEASEQFTLAVDGGFTSALVNLGNTAYLQGDYEAAVEHFNKALAYRPDSHAALIGLARAKYELDVFIEVDELYQKIKEIDPSLADRYSYLSSKIEGSVSRASSAANRKGDVFWDEGE